MTVPCSSVPRIPSTRNFIPASLGRSAVVGFDIDLPLRSLPAEPAHDATRLRTQFRISHPRAPLIFSDFSSKRGRLMGDEPEDVSPEGRSAGEFGPGRPGVLLPQGSGKEVTSPSPPPL